MKYSASIEDGERMTALDEKLIAPHKSSGEDWARVDQASAAQADSSRQHLLMYGWQRCRRLRPVFQTNHPSVTIVPCP